MCYQKWQNILKKLHCPKMYKHWRYLLCKINCKNACKRYHARWICLYAMEQVPWNSLGGSSLWNTLADISFLCLNICVLHVSSRWHLQHYSQLLQDWKHKTYKKKTTFFFLSSKFCVCARTGGKSSAHEFACVDVLLDTCKRWDGRWELVLCAFC